jgi:carbon-monoxide dehydrogenase iron sulfur subunit
MCAMLLYLADRCTGCRTCELACSMAHDNVFNPTKSRIRVQLEGVPELFTVNVCKSCGIPPCKEACPTDPKSIDRDEKVGGGMIINDDTCIKCGKCVEACPFAAISWHPDTNFPLVCDVCSGDPECVKFCASKALIVGGKKDLAEEKRKDYSHKEIIKEQKKLK